MRQVEKGVPRIQCSLLYDAVKKRLSKGPELEKRPREYRDLRYTLSGDWWAAIAAASLKARARALARADQREEASSVLFSQRLAEMQSLRTEAERDLLRKDTRRRALREADSLFRGPNASLNIFRETERLRELTRLSGLVAWADGTKAQRLRYHFNLLDPEQTGFVDATLLGDLLQHVGLALHPYDMELIRSRLEVPPGSGRIAWPTFQAWYLAEAGRLQTTLASRALQLQKAVANAFRGQFRADALWSAKLKVVRERCRELDCCLRWEDGDLHALHEFRSWNRRRRMSLERDHEGLL